MEKDYKKFDRAGDAWELDKERKKFKRKKICNIIEKIQKKGYYCKYDEGDDVYFDNGFNIVKATVIETFPNKKYKIKTSNNVFEISENDIFTFDNSGGNN